MKLISRKEVPADSTPVYDLRVRNNHNYCITQSNIVVHNSGKGTILKNLLGVEGRVLDVDEVKKMAQSSPLIIDRVKKEIGVDISKDNFTLKNPANVAKLHEIIADNLNLIDRKHQALFQSIMASDARRKPNVIFDVTLKDLKKLRKVAGIAKDLGYDTKNVHIVWVVNDVEIAKQQNKSRDRVVPENILQVTHEGASATMHEIVTEFSKFRSMVDGFVWLAFNKFDPAEPKKADTLIQFGQRTITTLFQNKNFNDKGERVGVQGSRVKNALLVKLKESGGPMKNIEEISTHILAKIAAYVPFGTKSKWGLEV